MTTYNIDITIKVKENKTEKEIKKLITNKLERPRIIENPIEKATVTKTTKVEEK